MTKNYSNILLLPNNSNIKNIKGIKISKSANIQLLFLIKKNKKLIKLGIKKKGCAGLQYFMTEIEHTKNHSSNIIFSSKDISIIININDLKLLDGITIDFVKEGLNKNFKFYNKKIKKFCGCGMSFDI